MAEARSPDRLGAVMFHGVDVSAVHRRGVGGVRFKARDVLASLQAVDDAGRAFRLMVMPYGLIVWPGADAPRSGRTIASHVPWRDITLSGEDGSSEALFGVRVNTAMAVFHAWMRGESGRRALRDFVVLVQARGAGSPGLQGH